MRERVNDWRERIEHRLGRRVVELTGDVHPDLHALRQAAVIVTTPEKWDCVSRAWRTRPYVLNVRLIVIDEIHLLGFPFLSFFSSSCFLNLEGVFMIRSFC